MGYEVVTMADCASNYGVFHVRKKSAAINGNLWWTVTWSGSESAPHCDCPSFQYSGSDRWCKHCQYVWDNACLYNPQWKDGREHPGIRPIDYGYDAIIEGENCPACGGPVVAVRRAV